MMNKEQGMVCNITDGWAVNYFFEVNCLSDLEKGVKKALAIYKAKLVSKAGFYNANYTITQLNKKLLLRIHSHGVYGYESYDALLRDTSRMGIPAHGRNIDFNSIYEELLISKAHLDGIQAGFNKLYGPIEAPKLRLVKSDKNIDKC